MSAANPIQSSGGDQKNAIDNAIQQAYQLIKQLINSPSRSSTYEEITAIAEKLDKMDPECKDQNLQLLIGSIEAIPETIKDLLKQNHFSQDTSFFQRQMNRILTDLSHMNDGYQRKDQALFDRNYILMLLDSYVLDVYEGHLMLSSAIDGLKSDLEDKENLKTLRFLHSNFLPQADFAKGTNGRTLVRSLTLAIKTVHDFWEKASSDKRQEMLNNLEIMNNKIIPMLDLPSFEDLDQFKVAFDRIKNLNQEVLKSLNRN